MAPIETSHPLLDPSVIERMTDAVYALDTDGRFTYLNAAAAGRFARQVHDLIGRNLWDTFPESTGTAFHQQCQRALREGVVIEHDGYFPACHAHLLQRIYPSDEGITVLVIDAGVGVAEARYHAIFANAGMGIAVADLEGRLVDSNAVFQQMLGYSADELLQKRFADITHPDDRNMNDELFQELLAGSRDCYRLEKRYCGKNGQVVWVDLAVSAILGVGGIPTAIIGTVIDITPRRQGEEALRRAHEELELTYRHAPVGLCVFDRELRYVRINERLAEINGLPAEEHIGRTLWEMVPDIADQAAPGFLRIFETGEPLFDVEITGETAARPGETRCWIEHWLPLRDAGGQVIGINVMAEEVTERKRAEAALRESEERYRLATSAVNGVVYDSDLNAGSMHVSEGTTLLLGDLPETNPIGHDWWVQRIHPDDAIRVSNEMQAIYARSGSYYDLEYRMRHADGRWIDVWDRGYIMRDADGYATRIIGSTHDITPLKEVDHAKDEFLAILSHELQTPLTSMLGFTSLAIDHDTLDMYRRAMPIIQRNAKRQARLVNELLDMSKLLQHRPECCPVPVDLGHLAMTKLEQMLPVAEGAGLTLQMTPVREPLPVCVDPAKMLLCIEHLIGNGIKFTPAGGQVTVECRQEHHQAILSVTDTGRGIAQEDLSKLFLPFRQVNRDEAAGGLGVGLAVVRGYVEWHGGRVQAESPGAGKGSTFTIRLPLLHGDAAEKALSGSVRKGTC